MIRHNKKLTVRLPSRHKRQTQRKPTRLIRFVVFMAGLSILGVVLATNKNTPDIERTPSQELQEMVTHSLLIPQVHTLTREQPTSQWKSLTVKSGDSPSSLFSQLEIHSDLNSILSDATAKTTLKRIRPGDKIAARLEDGALQELKYSPTPTTELHITRDGENFTTQLIEREVETRRVSKSATINNSLYLDGKKAGLSDNLIMQLVGVFAYDIDFALDIRKGDSFKVIYSERFLDGEKLRDSAIIAAEFKNKGKVFQAFRYTDSTGNTDYYTSDGRSLKKAFIRSPIKFARVSSHFNLKRMHPVLHKIRAHRGVDYAAKIGTPIRSTGHGKITFRGVKGGYGNTVIVKHGKQFTTLYAHLSKFRKGQKVGAQVKQGQIIGYVGKTGRVTGPHLHYEFRVNGVHKNPLTVKLPKSQPLAKSERTAFLKYIAPTVAQLNRETHLTAAR